MPVGLTPDEASRGFVQSSPSPLFKAKSFLDNVDETDSSNFCSEECEMIKKTLEDALEDRRHKKPLSRVPTDLFIPFQDTETFVPLGNCTEPGDEVSWAHEQLCSMCRGIYMLGENCFPTFFNSVLCNQQETGCIFDNFSDRAHGICRSETLSLRVLRNRGDAECEDWVIEHIELPCRLPMLTQQRVLVTVTTSKGALTELQNVLLYNDHQSREHGCTR
ncbi:hypothetical protein TELCIR_08221 [Teladorsagia circumcincta]|uniref:Uncharacterized protein n=1 Tax=Teladorsagia circumcincta TaxID=45464 RepID=A0A2G9UKB7_TELCI|nr:hypothetical protein TELCIR_08221 [Teladorsagia circumcincta]